MQTYELLYLTPLQTIDDARREVRDRVTAVVQSSGGSIMATREFSRQRLSYPLGKHDAGEYTIVEFTAAGDSLATIGRELRVTSGILRHLITVKSEKARPVGAEVAAMERERAARDAAKADAESAAHRAASSTTEEPKVIEDLDQRLEEILGKEMI